MKLRIWAIYTLVNALEAFSKQAVDQIGIERKKAVRISALHADVGVFVVLSRAQPGMDAVLPLIELTGIREDISNVAPHHFLIQIVFIRIMPVKGGFGNPNFV